MTATRNPEKTLAQAELEELVWRARTHTEAVAKLAGLAVNDVLLSELIVLDANGQATRDFYVTFGSIAVANFGTALVVHNAGPGTGAPNSGVGVAMIGAGMGQVVNLTGRSLTLYGSAGADVHLQVFTKSQPPSFGHVTL